MKVCLNYCSFFTITWELSPNCLCSHQVTKSRDIWIHRYGRRHGAAGDSVAPPPSLRGQGKCWRHLSHCDLPVTAFPCCSECRTFHTSSCHQKQVCRAKTKQEQVYYVFVRYETVPYNSLWRKFASYFQRWGEHVACPGQSLLALSPSMKGPSSSLRSHHCSSQLRNSWSKNVKFSDSFNFVKYMYLIVPNVTVSDLKSSYNHIANKQVYEVCKLNVMIVMFVMTVPWPVCWLGLFDSSVKKFVLDDLTH